MAIVKLAKDGYGQIELNQVAFRRDGRIEAQYHLDPEEFPEDGSYVAENGMCFAIDSAKRLLHCAADEYADTCIFGVNYSAEHMYDERHMGLKDFKLTGGDDFLPRVGYLAPGDKFTTNTICYDSDTYADLEAVSTAMESGTVYAGYASDNSGYWELKNAAPTHGPVLKVIEVTTMPDGQDGVKLQCIKA